MTTSKVSAVKVRNYDVKKAVKKAMKLADYTKYIKKDSTVVVKPNICWDLVVPGAQTSPWVAEAVLEQLKDRAQKIYVVEGDSNTHKAENGLKNTKIKNILEKMDLEFINLTRAKRKKIKIKNPLFFKNGLEVPKVILDADAFVTLPVLKTHGQATITGALKNQYGCLPNVRATYHLSLNEVIVDINRAMPPAFAVMDGTIGFEDNSPKLGKPKIMNLILASHDPVALDSTAAYIMGFDPKNIEKLRLAAAHGLGEYRLNKINITGEPIDTLRDPFIPSEGKDPVVKLNILTLKMKWLKHLVYDTPLFDIATRGATIYNTIWYHRFGKKYLKDIKKTSKYGNQWK